MKNKSTTKTTTKTKTKTTANTAVKPPKELSFQSKLERIADDMEYYALSVPEKITKQIGTKAAVPVRAELNGGSPFLGSFFPVGGGRHYMRVRVDVREEVKIKEGTLVRVKFTVRDRSTEDPLPKDVKDALRAEGALEAFEEMSIGWRAFVIRKIDNAARPETRLKRIQEVVEKALAHREMKADKK